MRLFVGLLMRCIAMRFCHPFAFLITFVRDLFGRWFLLQLPVFSLFNWRRLFEGTCIQDGAIHSTGVDFTTIDSCLCLCFPVLLFFLFTHEELGISRLTFVPCIFQHIREARAIFPVILNFAFCLELFRSGQGERKIICAVFTDFLFDFHSFKAGLRVGLRRGIQVVFVLV